MPTPKTDASVLREALRAFALADGSITDAARSLGVPRSTMGDRIRLAKARNISIEPPEKPRYRVQASSEPTTAETWQEARRAALRGEVGGPPIPDIARPPEGFIITRNGGAYDADGTLLRQWVQSKRDAGEEYSIPAGHVVKGESALVDPEGRIVARWIKTKEGAGEGLIDALREVFGEYEGRAGEIPAPLHTDDDLLTVYPIPDLHLGMVSWEKETGANYDVNIAVDLAIRSIESLVAQSRPSKKAILLCLGDYFHANDAKNVTPGSGHLLDVDGRWSRTYYAGAKLATQITDLLARKHTDIEVVFLAGNHDPDSAMSLRVALSLFYQNNPRINVCDDPGIAWFHRFGKVLLGGTHGHTMKPEKMAMMLATDRSEDWGQTVHRHMMFGHIHHQSMVEVGPVRVESFSSPAARDAWNAEHGYRATRSLSAITYHREDGEIGRHRVNITRSCA